MNGIACGCENILSTAAMHCTRN